MESAFFKTLFPSRNSPLVLPLDIEMLSFLFSAVIKGLFQSKPIKAIGRENRT